MFTEVIIAPEATPEASAILAGARRTCACWSPAACPTRARPA